MDPMREAVLIYTTVIVSIAIIVFGIVAAIVFLGPRKETARSFGLMFQTGNILRLATLIIVVIAASFLSLVDKLSNGAVAVLAGVAGFMLGNLERTPVRDETEDVEK
jgi:membrane associated rhomboid family serine protease